jgi:serine-type D-Ala-D-Ala carboxypeptidase (penicillin-binding protein 5/6)
MVAPFRLDSLEPGALAQGAPAGVLRHTHPSHRRRTGRRRRRRSRWRALAVLVLAAVLGLAGLAAVRLRAPAPVAAVRATMHSQVNVASSDVALPWAPTGESAIAIPSIGVNQTSGLEQPVPIASLTKMMTAYVVLRDHPLDSDQDGPSITMTQVDLDDFESDTVEDQANAQVAVGEVLTERQLLEGLLVHSANNLADTLARWDAGDIPTFVAKMNHAATQLNMDQTHYADPSGFDQGSQSTAGDLLKVAARDMDDPTFAAIVQMPSVTLPVAGTIWSYTPWLGFRGVIGVKSGFTTAAGGCDVVAVMRQVHGKDTMILAAVTGQTGLSVLKVAGYLALNLADHVSTAIGVTRVVEAGQIVARVNVNGHTVDAAAAASVDMLSWPGSNAHRALIDARTIRAGAKRGTQIGSLAVGLGTQREVVPVRLQRHLSKVSMLERLF